MDDSNNLKVRLESFSQGTANFPTSTVLFAVQPVISETIAVDYQTIDPVHMPGGYFTYKGTKSATYEISDIKLVSRNSQEATDNQSIRHTLRGWTKSYFGFGTAAGQSTPTKTTSYNYAKQNGSTVTPLTQSDIAALLSPNGQPTLNPVSGINASPRVMTIDQQVKQTLDSLTSSTAYQNDSSTQKYTKVPTSALASQTGKRFLGAPPEVLYLTAYSSATDNNGTMDKVTNITRVPVIITNLSITWPNDCDTIPTMEGEPFPIIMTISISLAETHSPQEYENFDLFKYREGRLPGF